ncbi:MAG TPA: hypothetical protein VHA75_04135 [Rugosimonospora sp.]|jgi:hypothetical protein|nr:hypothetical protein [Rugosimonospora sp.]
MDLTLIDPAEFRGQVYAATSLDGQWEYRQIGGSTVWSVTHVPTGRRYWVTGLDQAREQTGDGTAAAFLDIDKPLPNGKPLTKGEHMAITLELSAADMERMLTQVKASTPDTVGLATSRIRPRVEPGQRMLTGDMTRMLGVVYGYAPTAWVDALTSVRPDLVPPHITRHAAA